MIEVIKIQGGGYLAFFSPFGLFCGRLSYNKLLVRLLKNFKFIYGEIFSGDKFHDVSKDKAISITIWEYEPGIDTRIEDLQFYFEGTVYRFQKTDMVKDNWKYDERLKGVPYKGGICAPDNDRFNNQSGKFFHDNPKKGGSELIPENVKVPVLNFSEIPSELIYGLWSITVGNRAIVQHPITHDNAIIHFPNFNLAKTRSILAYSFLFAIITNSINPHYTKKLIGFFGMDRRLRFGSKALTNGVLFLLDKYADYPLGDFTIKSVYNAIKDISNTENWNPNYRKLIRKEISKILDDIKYWEYLPFPLKLTGIGSLSQSLTDFLK